MKQRLVLAVIVKEGKILSYATNEHECRRIGQPTGQGYELCDGCDYPNHAERKAIDSARKEGKDIKGATLYLHGHTYACKPCYEAARKEKLTVTVV